MAHSCCTGLSISPWRLTHFLLADSVNILHCLLIDSLLIDSLLIDSLLIDRLNLCQKTWLGRADVEGTRRGAARLD